MRAPLRIHLTQKAIKSERELQAPHHSRTQTVVWDDEVRGFGVRVSGVSNRRAYVAQHALPGQKKGPRHTIGEVGEIPLDQARQEARDFIHSIRHGIDPRPSRQPQVGGGTTLRQAFDLYLQRRNLTANSQRNYRNAVENHLSDWLDVPLASVTRDMVEQRYHELAKAEEGEQEEKEKSAAVANATFAAFRAIFNFAAERSEDMPVNPVVRLKRQWKTVPPRTRMVGADRMKTFFPAVLALPNPVARDFITILVFTGLRKEQLASLQWAKVDLTEGTIRVRPKYRKRSEFKLALADYPLAVLKRRREEFGNTDYVFPSTSKYRYIKSSYPFELIEKATGIKVSPHDLRRDFVSAAGNTTITPLALASLVDHVDQNEGNTTTRYMILSIQQKREAAQKICDLLKEWCGITNAQ